MHIFELVRKNLTQLTLLGVILGAVGSLLLRGRILISHPLSSSEIVHEADTGVDMPSLVFSPALDRAYSGAAPFLKPLQIQALAGEKSIVLIPDKYTPFAVSCSDNRPRLANIPLIRTSAYFRGYLEAHPEIISPVSSKHMSVLLFRGSVFDCHEDGMRLLASGVELAINITDPNTSPSTAPVIEVYRCRAPIAYVAFISDLYIAFLLMVFVPTLALSVVKSVVDSSFGIGASTLLKTCLKYLGATGLLAVMIGVGTGYVSQRHKSLPLEQLASVSLGEDLPEPKYDAHPLLTQLGNVIPTNPFSALSNPDGNKGLQVAFLAILLGLLLAVMDRQSREPVSRFLQRALALIVKDATLGWRALSEWSDLATPFGVFFVTLEFGSTIPANALHDLGLLIPCILAGLALYLAVLTAWVIARRNWNRWLHEGLIPGVSGLLTALATSSSYAALPQITTVPLLSKNALRRGIFDLNTTLNKCGTTLYISAVASFILFQKDFSGASLLAVFLFSILASVATAGLPFAAVFGLRMLLLAMNLPAGLAWLILPIDPVVDRFVTLANVYSNLAACSEKKVALTAGNPAADDKIGNIGLSAASA
jgi:Na+/H+-dicarboxylate symporter